MATLSKCTHILLLLTMILPAGVLAQLDTPAASPLGKVEQTVGIMKVSVEYSRPGIKGRKIFGGLVPYDEVWRTGANAPTKISFSDDVMLEGQSVPAGSYSLYTIPGKAEWTIIINKKLDGGERPDEKEDHVRFRVKPQKSPTTVETFTITISDIRTSTANLELAWENTTVKFGMEFDVDANVMAQIKEELARPYVAVANTFYQAASYYFNNDKDMPQALEWVNKSLELREDAFWVWRLKSRIQAALKDYDGAIATAKTGMKIAEEAGSKQFVQYNKDSIAEWQLMKK